MNDKRRIFFLCGDDDVPIGGNKKIYELVDVLNKYGFKAYVMHSSWGYRFTWFKNNTPIVYPSWNMKEKFRIFKRDLMRKVRWQWDTARYPKDMPLEYNGDTLPPIGKGDIVVISELMVRELITKIGDQPFVIFNQNAYLTISRGRLPYKPFQGSDQLVDLAPYESPSLLGVMVVSQDNYNYLHYVFPNLKIYPLRITVDSKVFNFDPDKRKQITYMPRKCSYDVAQVISILLKRGNLKGWTFVPIDNKTENEVVEILKKSAIFLSFSFQEGFPLPPLEALFSGCLVVGYHGQGAKVYLHPPYGYPIEANDILGYAKQVEELALAYESNPEKFLIQTRENAALFQSRYSNEQEEADIVNAWKSILGTFA